MHLPTFLIFFLCLLFLSPCGTAATIEGIVLTDTGPLPEAKIIAFPDIGSLLSGRNGLPSQQAEKKGQFHLELSPGTYFFVAHGSQNGQNFFSYHGLNPITVSEKYHWLPFFAVKSTPPLCKAGPTAISGVVTLKDRPIDRGNVSVYSLQDRHFRGMGLFTNTLSSGGEFQFELEPGRYIVIARQRQENGGMGPLKKGDLFCYPEANPVEVSEGQSCEVELPCYPRNDIDSFLSDSGLDPRGRRQENRRAASLQDTPIYEPTAKPSGRQNQQAILAGKVTDLVGIPRPDFYVSAYPANIFPLFQMYVIRLITRHIVQTDQQGRYQLELDPGEYYLVAREKIGEAPDHLEFYGLYEGNANHAIVVGRSDKTDNVDIVVEQIMP